jgi:hypothetical protein
LTEEEIQGQEEIKVRNLFDEEIERRLGPSAKPDDFEDQDNIEPTNPDLYEDYEQEQSFASGQDDIPNDACENHIGAELTLQQGDQVATACIKKRKVDDFGNAMGKANTDLILDAWLHALEFQDGADAECSANVIAENMWAQSDIDGNRQVTLLAR